MAYAQLQQPDFEIGIPLQGYDLPDPRAQWRAQKWLVAAWLVCSVGLLVAQLHAKRAPDLPTAAALLSICGVLWARVEHLGASVEAGLAHTFNQARWCRGAALIACLIDGVVVAVVVIALFRGTQDMRTLAFLGALSLGHGSLSALVAQRASATLRMRDPVASGIIAL